MVFIEGRSFDKKKEKMKYPITRKDETVDQYFGTKVEDPYRWLEDDQSEETKQWVIEQNKVTRAYLDQLPGRQIINDRLTELWNYPKVSAPFQKGGRWFVFKNDGLQNQMVLLTMPSPEATPDLLIDPNALIANGTVSLTSFDVSEDGKYLIYQLAKSGSDWNEIFVLEIDSRTTLEDRIEWVKFSGITSYKNGFYYSAYQQPKAGKELSDAMAGQKVFYHKIGTAQSEDLLIFENTENSMRMHSAFVGENEDWLFISESESTSGNGLWAKHQTNDAEFKQIASGFDIDYIPIETIGDQLLVLTNENASKYQVASFDLSANTQTLKTIIPESNNTLESVLCYGEKLFCLYMEDAKSKVEIYSLQGEYLGELPLPSICSITEFKGNFSNNLIHFTVSSFNTPGTVYQYNIKEQTSKEIFRPEVKFNADDFQIDQHFFESKDGTKVPMFLFYKKGIKLDGNNPTLLYGYGGFNISLQPSFAVSNVFFAEQGGIYAMVNLRGGGEYGETWHEAGTKLKKQNVFNDFISAAEYLIVKKYTSAKKLAIRGGSNGGLLVGATLNQRPDLFRVALPAVGVMDMLRYHKFTIGYAWASDYGTSEDDDEMFEYLLKYSPYHSIKNSDYPSILAFTADHDDRVVPAHTFKYMARIQELNKSNFPTLVRIETEAGHGAGKPTSKTIEEFTDLFSFLMNETQTKVK